MRSLKNLKLKHQILSLIGISVFLIIFFQVINYFRVSSLIQERAESYLTNSINQVEENLRITINDVEKAGFKVAYNQFIQDYLMTDQILVRKNLTEYIDNFISYVIDTNDDIYGGGFVEEDGDWINFYGNLDFLIFRDIKNKYNFVESDFNKPVFKTVESNGDIYYSYIVPIFSIKQNIEIKNRIGTVILLCNTKNINNIIGELAVTSGSKYMVLDEDRMVISSNLEFQEGKMYGEIPEEYRKEKKFIVKEKILANTEWKIYGIISIREVTSDLKFLQKFVFLIGIIMIILILLTGYVLNKNINYPIVEIVQSIKKIGKKDIKQRLDLPVKGELGIIVQHINKMLDKLETLSLKDMNTTKLLYETKISKKEAELSALQSQINPHFLYNTLECMRSIGKVYGSNEIVDISTAMADIFRYSIKASNFVKVEMELEIIKEYLKIIQLRFRDRIGCEFDIDERLLQMQIIKMSLQPIVENAIYHGLENKQGKGHLSIKGRIKGGEMVFSIEDDGQGMEERELKELQLILNNPIEKEIQSDKMRGIGLININKRIRLYLGKEYGLNIHSIMNKGTRVEIRLPLQLPPDVKE